MNKNHNLSQLDPNQISTKEHDSTLDAKRVILVGGENLNISVNEDKLVDAIKDGLRTIKIDSTPALSAEKEIVEKHVFIPQIEIREIEKHIYVPQIEYRTIEVPVVTERIVTIERPVIIKETEFKEIVKERHYPKLMQICAVIQALGVIFLLILNVIKK